MGIRPLCPEVIWDLHGASRTQATVRELNGDGVAVSKLRGRRLVRPAMRRKVVEGVVQKRLVIRADRGPIQGPAVRLRPPHAHRAVRLTVVHRPLYRRQDRYIEEVLTDPLSAPLTGAQGREPAAPGLLLGR